MAKPVLDRLQKALDETRKDGKHRRITVDRGKFLQDIPSAMQDPRFQLMPQNRPTVIIEFEKNEHITVAEILELCNRDPTNPLSITYLQAIVNLDSEQVIAVRVDQLEQLRNMQAIAISRGMGANGLPAEPQGFRESTPDEVNPIAPVPEEPSTPPVEPLPIPPVSPTEPEARRRRRGTESPAETLEGLPLG